MLHCKDSNQGGLQRAYILDGAISAELWSVEET